MPLPLASRSSMHKPCRHRCFPDRSHWSSPRALPDPVDLGWTTMDSVTPASTTTRSGQLRLRFGRSCAESMELICVVLLPGVCSLEASVQIADSSSSHGHHQSWRSPCLMSHGLV
uniref:Uncharacterized protein n=1 Tax=Arundo donax TaxID=35708 RepID=A0A0A9FUA2_ARUDO